ncbi:MAG: ABC transporter permease subunit [Sphaerochaetaceae bacterium]|nr:ABC transporter permease subunit [Sphaerochaetaceae bacterium]
MKKLKKANKHQYWQLYAMMVLPLLYFIIFKYVPMFGNILAFRRYRPGMGPFGTEWVGLRYFKLFFKDAAFWTAFKNTLILSLLNLIINFPIPIIFALLLNEIRNRYFKKFVQTISYMPRFISTVVVIAIVSELLSPSTGILNIIRGKMGLDAIYYMNDPAYFRTIYVLLDTWQYTGWTAIIYLASITSISPDMYEAATIDGANRIQQIFYVTIPTILPTIMVMLILNIGRLLSLGFEKILLLYTPTNSQVSDILDTLVYRTGLANQNYSYATAIGLFTGIIGIILVTSSNNLSKKLTGQSIY